jgi:hypothetical protein
VKAVASILFAFLLLWHPTTSDAGGACGSDLTIACATCCCAPRGASIPSVPLAPVQSRAAATEQLTLLAPTFNTSLQAEQAAKLPTIPPAEFSCSAGAVPLFQRDCALLL